MKDHAYPRLPRVSRLLRRGTAIAFLLTMALLSSGPIGCAGLLQQPAPAKDFFDIEPGSPAPTSGATPATAAAAAPIVQVRPVRVRPPYDGTDFVYKTGPTQFELDYYNNFVASPSALLTGDLVDWLEKDGLPTVGGTSVRSELVLEADVTKLLVDFADPAKPRAVLAARFFLLRSRSGGTTLVSHTEFEAGVPVTTRTPAGYSAAWGQAMRQILQDLVASLHAALSRQNEDRSR